MTLFRVDSNFNTIIIFMKIGFVLSNAMIGGYQTTTVRLANRIGKDYEVCIAIVDAKNADKNLLDEIDKDIPRVLYDELVEKNDIIHITRDLSEEYRKKLKKKWNRTILLIGSYPHKKMNWFVQFRFRHSQNFPPNVVTTSKFVGDLLGINSTVIRGPVDIDVFRVLDEPKIFDIAILGRMRPVKNHKLFAEICRKGGYSFVAIGGTHRWMDGHVNDIEKMLRAQARVGIDCVTGFVPLEEVIKRLNQAKIALIVSDYEAGGGIEQMACGMPVVARRVGGVPEFIYPYDDLLVPYDAPAEAYIEKINKYINDLELRKRVREHVVNNFSIDIVAKKYEELYMKILKDSS